MPWILLGLVLLASGVTTASAQPPPDQSPFSQPPLPPPNPQPTVPPAVLPAGISREAQYEARIQQLESMVNQLSTQMQQISARSAVPSASGPAAPAPPGMPAPTMEPFGPGAVTAPGTVLPNIAPGAAAPPDIPNPATAVAPSRSGGVGAPGQSLPPNPPPSNRFDSPATLESKKGNFRFGPGFELRSDDDEYIMQFHDLTQLEYRGYQQGGQTNVRDAFLIPRQWFMFSGRISKPLGYFVSFANGFDVFSILDVFLDLEYDPRFRVRFGRFKTPFTYEFFVEPVQALVVPERSIFFNNFAQNRDIGVMGYGRLLNSKLDYAGGIFNGVRNGLVELQNSKKVTAFVNYRPFGNQEDSLFENFNIGGSVYAGESQQVPIPQTFRTVVPTAGNTVAGIPFLGLNNNVRESGFMAFWDLHLAWFYKQWAFVGEWEGGTQAYALTSAYQNRFRIPVQGFYAQTSYLLTGETRSQCGIVKPLHPFDLRKGQYGTGAIEPYVRYEYMDIGNQVFTDGLADKNLWANRLWQVWAGVDWHLTQYMKASFGWNHTEFNQPVSFAPGRSQLTSDLFMLRFQLYF